MPDFTIRTYGRLLNTLDNLGYSLVSVSKFTNTKGNSSVCLRHDVDRLPENSMKFARLLSDAGYIGTFYFRAGKESFDERIIGEIANLGHEIGYHYEDMDTASKNNKLVKNENELVKIALAYFIENITRLRRLAPVATICMHGSPMSKWDSRLLWKHYNYKEYGINIEPYFDINFDEVLYLTDTGRRWDGSSFAIRDKAIGVSLGRKAETSHVAGNVQNYDLYKDWVVKPLSGSLINMTVDGLSFQNTLRHSSTYGIIRSAEDRALTSRIMMTFHPQRWTDDPLFWARELVWQNVKNIGKYFILKTRNLVSG
jgi:hypothetical protein